MDFNVETTGFDTAIEDLKDIEEDLGQGGPWIVGTKVNYAIYLEAGTSKMSAKPFFRPALAEVRMQGIDGFIDANTRKSVDEIDDVADLVKTLALALERRIKQIITAKGLVDTGTLRASVTATRGGVGDLPSLEEAQEMASADVEVDA